MPRHTEEERRRRRVAPRPPTLLDELVPNLSRGLPESGRQALRGFEDLKRSRTSRAFGSAVGDIAVGTGGVVAKPVINAAASAGSLIRRAGEAGLEFVGGLTGIGGDRPPSPTGDAPAEAQGGSPSIRPGGPGLPGARELGPGVLDTTEVLQRNFADPALIGQADERLVAGEEEVPPVVPANVGGAASQVVRPPPPPPEPEGIEVIRGTDRKFQQVDAEGSTRNQPEFSLLPGRSVAESREAAAFGDPNFVAQQESRQNDIRANAAADVATAAIVNSIGNSGQIGLDADGVFTYNVINPATGQYEPVDISPWVAAMVRDPETHTLVKSQGRAGEEILTDFNTATGVSRRVSTKNDQELAVTLKFLTMVEGLRENGDDDPVENARQAIEDEYGSMFLDMSFLGAQ